MNRDLEVKTEQVIYTSEGDHSREGKPHVKHVPEGRLFLVGGRMGKEANLSAKRRKVRRSGQRPDGVRNFRLWLSTVNFE